MSHSLSKKFTFGSLLLFALPTTVMMVVMSLYTIAVSYTHLDVYKRQGIHRGLFPGKLQKHPVLQEQ